MSYSKNGLPYKHFLMVTLYFLVILSYIKMFWTEYNVNLPELKSKNASIYTSETIPHWMCYITYWGVVNFSIYCGLAIISLVIHFMELARQESENQPYVPNFHLSRYFLSFAGSTSIYIGWFFWTVYSIKKSAIVNEDNLQYYSWLNLNHTHSLPTIITLIDCLCINHDVKRFNWLKDILPINIIVCTIFHIWLIILKENIGTFPYGVLQFFWDMPYHCGYLLCWFVTIWIFFGFSMFLVVVNKFVHRNENKNEKLVESSSPESSEISSQNEKYLN